MVMYHIRSDSKYNDKKKGRRKDGLYRVASLSLSRLLPQILFVAAAVIDHALRGQLDDAGSQ